MDEVKVYVETEVNPTESEDKVRRAVENVLGSVNVKVKPSSRGSILIGEGKGLETLSKLYNILRRERIRDAARTVLFRGLKDNTIRFYLNKQAAFAGHVSFSEATGESPLGPIHIRIICDKPRELIEWLAPKTT